MFAEKKSALHHDHKKLGQSGLKKIKYPENMILVKTLSSKSKTKLTFLLNDLKLVFDNVPHKILFEEKPL